MKTLTIQLEDNVYKELLTTMKFKKIMGNIHGVEDEFILLILTAIESKKSKLRIEEKQKTNSTKISEELTKITKELKKGSESGNSK
jgi:hypothetical protein